MLVCCFKNYAFFQLSAGEIKCVERENTLVIVLKAGCKSLHESISVIGSYVKILCKSQCKVTCAEESDVCLSELWQHNLKEHLVIDKI